MNDNSNANTIDYAYICGYKSNVTILIIIMTISYRVIRPTSN